MATLGGLQDFRHPGPTDGVIENFIKVRESSAAPEVPFANAIVWAIRRLGGQLMWSGVSAADGSYRANRLLRDEEYIVIGIDPTGTHQATAAGPVIAVQGE